MNLLQKIGFKPWNGTRFFISLAAANTLLMILCSYKLWSSIGRTFYKVPLVPFELPNILDVGLFALLIFSLLASIFSNKSKMFVGISLGLLGLFIALDIHRLQVWVYQAILIFLVPFLAKKPQQQLQLFTLIIGGTYLWAGLHKINFAFYDVVYPWFMGTYQFTKPLIDYKYLSVIPIGFEIILGILVLLSGKWLKYAFYLSIIFHSVILFFLGPWGNGWNFIVYPWNIFSPFLVGCLYQSQAVKKVSFRFFPSFGVYVLLCLLLPSLYIFNKFPANLSFSLYAGRGDYAYFTTYNAKGRKISQKNIGEWANNDLYIPHFKSDWVHRYMAKKHIQLMNDAKPRGLLIVKYKNPVFSKEREAFDERLTK